MICELNLLHRCPSYSTVGMPDDSRCRGTADDSYRQTTQQQYQPAKVVYSELPDPSVLVKTDKLCVLLSGGLLQLPGKLLLLLGVGGGLPSRFVPFEDLVQGNLSRLVQAISQVWLLGPPRWVHLSAEKSEGLLNELAYSQPSALRKSMLQWLDPELITMRSQHCQA